MYLAGPDVFAPDADRVFSMLKQHCRNEGLLGLSPFDNEQQPEVAGDLSKFIYRANCRLIEQCDAVIANLEPFRGPSADVGTVFEMGLARGLGKPVFGYNAPGDDYKDRIGPLSGHRRYRIEDFSLFDNLMVAHAPRFVANSFESAVIACATYLKTKRLVVDSDAESP